MNPANKPDYLTEFFADQILPYLSRSNTQISQKEIKTIVDVPLKIGAQNELRIKESYFNEPCRFSSILANTLIINDCYFKSLEISIESLSQIDIVDSTIEHLVLKCGTQKSIINILSESDVVDEMKTSISYIRIEPTNSIINFHKINFEIATIENFSKTHNYSCAVRVDFCNRKSDQTNSSVLNIDGSTGSVSIQNSNLFDLLIQESNNATLVIRDSNILNDFKVRSVSIPSVHLENSSSNFMEIVSNNLSFFRILNGKYGDLKFSVKEINSIQITGEKEKEKPKLNNLDLNSTTLLSDLYISHYSINKLNLNNFTNRKKAIFQEISFQESVSMVYCNLNEAEFNNVAFDADLNFTIKNSDLLKVKFHTVDWMNQHKLNEYPDTSIRDNKQKLQHYLTIKETYRQLKEISIKSLNKFDALNFQRNEQRMYEEILWLKGNKWDFFLLWTNGIFNDYGLSYKKPFLWLICVHLFWFITLLIQGDTFNYTIAFPWWSDGISGKYTWHAFGDYVTTLLPIHSNNYLHEVKGFPQVIDVLMRLTSGYFIYYFISATRKFHISN